MKYKTFYITRSHVFMPWCIDDKIHEPFICAKNWDVLFPHLRNRQSLRLTVHTHPVKGSMRFKVCHPHKWVYRVIGQDSIFLAMSVAVKDILEMYGKDTMFVWVTVK